MRQSLVISTSFALVLMSATARSMPVFLKPDSRFATGHQARSKLEEKTRKVQFQRWFRVQTKDKVYGWIAEDHALTSLKLASQVRFTEDTPARRAPELDAILGRPIVKNGTTALVLEISGSWSRVQPFPAADFPEAWVPNEKLAPVLSGGVATTRAFVYQNADLKVDSAAASRTLTKIEEGTYVQIIRAKEAWLEVQTGRYQGFIKKSEAWTTDDLGEKGVRAAISLAPLRSAPLPYADLVRSLSFSSTLTQLSSQTLRWGLASTKEQGDVWWPMSDEADAQEIASLKATERTSDISEKIPTSLLFARKIYDMATSRAVPSLKFVSAEGIFRTVDGEQWTRIPLFRDQNYPIAVARSGAVFIGPYVSEDHGETFQQWIRWDALVSSLSRRLDVSPRNLKILEIRPEDAAGHKVTLRLNLGIGEPVRVATDDQGLSWRSF